MLADKDGHFHFEKLCPGRYLLLVSFIGYADQPVSIDLSRKNTEINIKLVPQATQLSMVDVKVRHGESKPLQISSRLGGKDLQLSRGQSLGEALKTIPGLSSVQTGPSISKPVIHGLHSNRVLIYNAGVRQEGQQWGSEHAPEIDPFIAGQVSIVKGAASVMYGADALGGVILVEPEPLRFQQALRGELNLAGMSNNGLGAVSAMAEASPGNHHFSWRIQGTVKEAGNSKTADYYMRNTGFNEYNGAVMFGYRKERFEAEVYASSFNSKLGIFTGSHIGSTTDLMNAISRDEPYLWDQAGRSYKIERPYQQISHGILKIKSGYRLPAIGKLQAQYSYQQNNRKEYDLVRQSNEDNYQLKFDLSTQTVDLFLDHKEISGLSGRVGINGIFQQNFYKGRYLIPFFDSQAGGAYLIERWRKNRFELEAGLRYDQKWIQARLRENVYDNNSPEIRPEFRFSQVSGTAGALYNLPSGYKINTTIARAWRPPAINELFSKGVHHGSASFEIGDPDLKEEASLNITAGISRMTGKLQGEFSLYYNRINNYIYLKPGLEPVLTVRGAFPSFRYVQVDARFSGADMLLSYQVNKVIKAGTKYSTVRAYNIETDQHLEFIPADKYTAFLSISLPDLKFLKASSIDLTGTYNDKQRRVKADQDYAPAPDAYTLFNIDLSTAVPVGRQQWNISLSAWNLFNTSYRDYLNRFRYFTDDTGRNIVLRLKIPFGKSNNN